MPSRLAADYSSVIDVLERVLDKGIVIDAWVRVSLVGIDLLTVEARVVIASITTYLGASSTLAAIQPGSGFPSAPVRPPIDMSWRERRSRDVARPRARVSAAVGSGRSLPAGLSTTTSRSARA